MEWKKFLSRKLLVAIVAVIAIATGIFKNSPEAEEVILQQGTNLTDVLIAAVASSYVLAQGIVDAFKK